MKARASNGSMHPERAFFCIDEFMKLPALLLASALAGASAFGNVLIYDSFSYSDGNLAGRGGWSAWAGITSPIAVSGGTISVVSGAGNREDIILPWGARLAAGQKIYAAFDLKVSAFTTNHYFAHFRGVDASQPGRIFLTAPVAGGNFRVGVSNNSASAPTGVFNQDLSFGVTYKVIVAYDFDLGTTELWVNPASENSAKAVSTEIVQALPLAQFGLRQGTQVSSQVIDNLIIGTTFGDVLTAPVAGTPVQGLGQPAYLVAYTTDEDVTAAFPSARPFDWADNLPTPSNIGPAGSIARSGAGGFDFSGWAPTFDVNNYVGFRVTAQSGVPMLLTSLDFFTSANSSFGITSYKWGYRVDDGSGYGEWVFGNTYTPAHSAFSDGFKTWDFPDFSTTGTVEFGLFATSTVPSTAIRPYTSRVTVNTAGMMPFYVMPTGTGFLGAYTNTTRYNIDVSEASAIAYNWETDTLFSMGDEGTALVELSRNGRILSSMGFQFNVSPREARALDDSEGVTYLGGGKFMIADERRNLGVVTAYEPGAVRTLAELAPTSYAFGAYDSNSGLEGISYDPINNSIWGVKETSPKRIYEMTDFGGAAQTVSEPVSMRHLNRLGINQWSDIYVMAHSAFFAESDPRRQNILVLARSQRKLIEVDRAGNVLSALDLTPLGRDTIEGLTMDDKGNIYLSAEGAATNTDSSPTLDAMYIVSVPKNPVLGNSRVRQAILGTAGDDEIVGNQATDIITGGGGRDIYVYKSLRDGVDTITDFKPAVDTLDFKVLLASIGYTGAAPLADGTVRVIDSASGAIVQVKSAGSYRNLIVLQGLTVEQADSSNNFVF